MLAILASGSLVLACSHETVLSDLSDLSGLLVSQNTDSVPSDTGLSGLDAAASNLILMLLFMVQRLAEKLQDAIRVIRTLGDSY